MHHVPYYIVVELSIYKMPIWAKLWIDQYNQLYISYCNLSNCIMLMQS